MSEPNEYVVCIFRKKILQFQKLIFLKNTFAFCFVFFYSSTMLFPLFFVYFTFLQAKQSVTVYVVECVYNTLAHSLVHGAFCDR